MPTSRLALSLVLALGAWAPTCKAALAGEISVDAALVRYLIAFFGARVAVSFIGTLMHRYNEMNAAASLAAEASAIAPPGGPSLPEPAEENPIAG